MLNTDILTKPDFFKGIHGTNTRRSADMTAGIADMHMIIHTMGFRMNMDIIMKSTRMNTCMERKPAMDTESAAGAATAMITKRKAGKRTEAS